MPDNNMIAQQLGAALSASPPMPPAEESPPEPHPHEPVLRRTSRLLPCRLTDAELLRLGSQLADALDAVSTESGRADSVKQELKARMTGLESRVTELSMRLRRREEERDVAVEERADFAVGVARTIRLDTGEALSVRDLTPAERQPALPLFAEPGQATSVTFEASTSAQASTA